MKDTIKAVVRWNDHNAQIVEGSYDWVCGLVGERNILFVFI